MKTWIICKYGANHIQSPNECIPIGIAYQKTVSDDPSERGFVAISEFEAWLKRKDLCAFSDGYKKALVVNPMNNTLTVMYGK